jgi:hypothetical protein
MTRTLFPVGSLAAVLLGCAGGLPGPKMPTPLVASEAAAVRPWVDAGVASGAVEARFRWRFQDARGEASGRGSYLIVPRDSLRFDFRGPLNSGAGAAFVIGDSAVWAEPAEDVEKLVPNYPLLWAMLGRARGPAAGDRIESFSGPGVNAWRYVRGGDTVEYLIVREGKHQLVANVRSGGERVGRVLTTFDSAGRIATARLDIPSRPARLDLTFYRHATPDSLPASLWARPDDDAP